MELYTLTLSFIELQVIGQLHSNPNSLLKLLFPFPFLLPHEREGDCPIKIALNFAFGYINILRDLFSSVKLGQTVKS